MRLTAWLVLGFLAAGAVVAMPSFPPLVEEGEHFENVESLLAGISRASLVHSVAFSLDGKTLASGSYDGTVRLWDVASRTALETLQGHTDVVQSVAFSPDGRTLASGSSDGTVRLWDVASRCRRLADRLGVEPEPADADAELRTLPFGADFPLNLDHGLLHLPPADRAAADVLARLRARPETRDQVTLVIAADPARQDELQRLAGSDLTSLQVVPSGSQLTELFLAADPVTVLARIIASQVRLTRVCGASPRRGAATSSWPASGTSTPRQCSTTSRRCATSARRSASAPWRPTPAATSPRVRWRPWPELRVRRPRRPSRGRDRATRQPDLDRLQRDPQGTRLTGTRDLVRGRGRGPRELGDRRRARRLGRAGGPDKERSRLDRVLVYATVRDGGFTLEDALRVLSELDLAVEGDRLQRSLRRLELAYVLGREDGPPGGDRGGKHGRYVYQVPLFVQRILAQEPEALLGSELRRAAGVTGRRSRRR
jgi:hypothetical protein